MGCDIHVFIEKRNKKTDKEFTLDFSKHMHRDYELFYGLAGVRAGSATVDAGIPKGFPASDASSEVLMSYARQVVPDDSKYLQSGYYSNRVISKSEFDKTVKQWSFDFPNWDPVLEVVKTKYVREENTWVEKVNKYLPHLDWHTPSWVSPTELRDLLDALSTRGPERAYSLEYWYGLLGYMEGTEKVGMSEVRMVFWFDN